MNGIEESFRCNSPRLPAEGQEIKGFHDSTETVGAAKYYRSAEKICMASPGKDRAATPIRHCSSEEHFQSNGQFPRELSHPMDNGCDPTGPVNPYRWGKDLLCLLHDKDGSALFNQFLVQEGESNKCLNFWLACTSLKTIQCTGTMENMIKALHRSFVKRSRELSQQTREEIRLKVYDKQFSDPSIFDNALKEIEDGWRKVTYPNFLQSDVYIQYLRSYHDRTDTVEKECQSNSPDPNVALPTVHEDSELQITISSKLRLSKEPWLKGRISDAPRSRSEAPLGRYLKSPAGNYGSYHLKYSSFLPTSAQDSELQSLSSDAQTDDTMSQTGSSVDCGPTRYSRSHLRKHQKAVKHNATLNKDSLASNNFIPRTQRVTPESMTPEQFHSLLVKKLNSYLDEVKLQERINDKLRSIEGCENASKPAESNPPPPPPIQRPQGKALFEPTFFTMFECFEENDQDILDRHISRVWQDSAHQTPVLSPGCESPSVRTANELTEFGAPPCRTGAEAVPSVALQSATMCSFTARQNVQLVPNPQVDSLRHRRDHDTRSYDSGTVLDYVSEEALASSQKGINSPAPGNPFVNMLDPQRRHKEQSRRSMSRNLAPTDSSSSCVDSGVSLVCNPHEKVTNWLEMKKFAASTSPVQSRSSSSKRPIAYNNCRPIVTEGFSTSRCVVPSQPFAQDSFMPALPPPDTTTQLVEARRRLVEDERCKIAKLKKQNRKSAPTVQESLPSSTSSEMTIVGYCYGNHSVPYLSKFPGRNITLKQFKSHLSKKGNFRYFFKKASNDFGTGVVMEEISDDSEILPLWEGKVFSVIESTE